MKAAKLSLALLLVLLMALPFLATPTEAATDWTGYTPISTAEELDNVRNNLSGKYYLTKDIVLTGTWNPIGNGADSLNSFSGVFDGNGHTISGLQVSSRYYYGSVAGGLFGYVSGTVQNLEIASGEVDVYCGNSSSDRTRYAAAGGIAGYVMSGATIENCINRATISADVDYNHTGRAGGIAGYNTGTIRNCHNYGQVANGCDMGGIAGRNNGGIYLSSNHGSIINGCNSNYNVGGIAGYCWGTISQCYNTATLGDGAYAWTGGIAGYLDYGRIHQCYNAGNLNGPKSAGIFYTCLGTNSSANTITDCYNIGRCGYGIAYSTRSGYYQSCSITGSYHLDNVAASVGNDSYTDYSLTFAEMCDAASYAGYNFEETWKMPQGEGYPFPILQNNPMDTSIESISWETKPTKTLYLSGESLDVTGGVLKVTCKSGAELEAPLTADMVTGFKPKTIGAQKLTVTYCGKKVTFEVFVRGFAGGSGTMEDPYQIANQAQLLCVEYEMDAHYKLVADIKLTDPDFRGIGGGTSYDVFSGTFDGNGHYISGFTFEYDKIMSCWIGMFGYNTGTIRNLGVVDLEINVKGTSTMAYHLFGGIAAYNAGTIENCYVLGDITLGTSSLEGGGIAAYNYGTIENCFNAACLTGASVAGICYDGYAPGYCYNVGMISGSYETYGIMAFSANVNNCYYLDTSSTVGDANSVISSYNDTVACTLKQMGKAETFRGFDFDTVWEMSDSPYYPFPVLKDVPLDIVPQSISVTTVPEHVYGNLETKKLILDADQKAEVTLTAKNGAKLRYPLTLSMISGNTPTKAGPQKLTVKYAGKSATMTTTVYAVNSGKGTAKSPYILKDKYQLHAMRMDPSAYYRLGANITFKDTDAAWEPIGSFSGQLDGAGYRIEGMKIDKDFYYSDRSVGLFNVCSGTIKKLGMVDCTVSADFSGGTNYIGGFVGVLDGGTISQCYFAGSVTASGYSYGRVGGIAGKVTTYGRILDCYNLGTLDGNGMSYCWLGGIVAHNYGEVSRCYNAGKLSSANPRGTVGYDEYSIINYNYYLNNGALTCSGAKELTDAQMKNANYFVGFDFDDVWVMRNKNGYRYPELRAVALKLNVDSLTMETAPTGAIYNEKTGTATACGGTLKVTYTNGLVMDVEMRDTKVSGITSGSGTKTATFTFGGKSVKAKVPVCSVASGSGTASDPYCISKKTHLKSLYMAPYAHFKLTADIKFTSSDFAKGGAFYNDGKLWMPIGTDYYSAFSGSFDGGKHTITGLKIKLTNKEDTNTNYVGMFGYVSGTVKNLRLQKVDIQSEVKHGYVGGIAGAVSGTISNCHVESGTIVAKVSTSYHTSAVAAGIAGYVSGGTITGCHNAADVDAMPISQYDTAHAAGIAGTLDGGTITKCYNLGSMDAILMAGGGYGPAYAGGIVAVISSGTVSDCYNAGTSRGSYGNGGIAGLSYGTVSNCYNTAKLDRGYYGAIVGIQNGSMSNCYYLDTTGRGTSQGTDTATKLTTAKMKKQASFKGFDFSKTWTMSGSKSYAYPELRSHSMMIPLNVTKMPVDANAANGKSVSVKVTATGDGLTYQWYIKNATEKTYTKSSNTTNTYKCTMSSTNAGRKVYCVVTDKYGNSVKTDVVTLSNLVIKTQPVDKTAANGKSVSVSVKATGTGLKYQWYFKNAGSSSFSKASATTATYKCTMSKTVNGRQVYCKITDKFGNTVKTETVTLSNLTITTQPKDATAANGKTASVTVKASGTGLKYQWYIKDTGSGSFSKSSVTTATYKCTMSSKNNGRQVYCKITDKFGNTVKTETVALSNLVIKTQPTDKTAANGKSVSVSVKATGSGLKYQWYYKDAGTSAFKKASATTATYKCTMSKTVNGRQVYCKITDKFGNTVKTETVTLSNLTITAQPKSTGAANGKSVSVSVKATGSGLKYQWYYKDAGASAFKKASATTATYKCTMSKTVNGRQVYCKITDKFGNTVQTVTVKLTKR